MYYKIILTIIFFISSMDFIGIYLANTVDSGVIKNNIFPLILILVNNGMLTYSLFILLSFSKLSFRVFYYLLFFLNTFVLLTYTHYSIFLNYNMIKVALSDLQFGGGVLDLSFIISLIYSGVLLPLFLDILYLKNKLSFSKKEYKKRLNASFIIICSISFFISFFGGKMFENRYKRYWSKGHLLPIIFNSSFFPEDAFSMFYTQIKNMNNSLLKKYKKETNLDNYQLKKDWQNKKQTIVFTFGESLNASHIGANGYERDTTPNIEKHKNLVFLKKAVSCATYTALAQPCMTNIFTKNDYYDKKAFFLSEAEGINSLPTIFKAKGFKVFYIGEHHYEKSLTLFRELFDPKNVFLVRETYAPKSFLRFVKKVIDDKSPKKIIFISTYGNHIFYGQNIKKYPVKENIKFVHNIHNKQDKQYLYNRYDNAILFTDILIGKTMDMLINSKQNSLMYFFSDHGENLVDNSLPVHGMDYSRAPYDVTHPAAFLWVSDQWLKNINSNTFNLFKRYQDKEFSHDNIFHSVLDCSGIESKYIDKKKSLCF